MSTDDLMTIGVFAFRASLSVPALRHYDEIGLLRPAHVGPITGYRRYATHQLPDARLVCRLRAVGLPIEEIRSVLGADERAIQRVLESHRDRLADEGRALQRKSAALEEFLEEEITMSESATLTRPVQVTIQASEVARAARFYSEVFDVEYLEDVSSLSFGAYGTAAFFLLTIEPSNPDHPDHPGRNACVGFLVDDVDEAHQRALAAGATEVDPPRDYEWKPRTSLVDDPDGNRLSLFQA